MKTIWFIVLMISALWSNSVTFKGEEVTLNSKGLKVGDKAPMFYTVDKDFQEVEVGGPDNKIRVIAFVPSFDTGVCKLETIAFNEKVAKMKDVEVIVVSKDLPFAIGRFCHDNKITNVITVSDYKDENRALRYGTTITSPSFLEGFFGRVVYVIDRNGVVTYKEVVPEITHEPDYDKLLKAIDNVRTK